MPRILETSKAIHGASFTRRECLRVGGIGIGGLTMPALAMPPRVIGGQTATSAGTALGKAKSVIVIFLGGGPPQHETWDPKPEAPEEIRGGFGSIATKTPGLSVGELMPLTATLTHKIAVLRAMVTNDNAHSSSGYQMMTGVPHIPLNAESAVSKLPNLAPHWGAVAKFVKQQDHRALPTAVTLPNRIANMGVIPWPGQIAGVLGAKYDPWLLTCDPSQPQFKIPDLTLPAEVSELRFQRRLALLNQVNRNTDRIAESSAVSSLNRQTQQALGLLSGSKSRQVFDLSQETDATRDRYGRTRWAQSVLLARRLVEAGVSLVQVNWCKVDNEPNGGSWDTHDKHNDLLGRYLMPWMDKAYSALLTDLSERGLLDETLVLWVGEFGHTPKFNARAGRDHWGHCFSIALAGGGVQGGRVYGKSDSQAAYPISGAVQPRDLLATVFHCLGYAPETELHDTAGRPLPISRGRVIKEIL
jgi:hypothetical protein